MVQRINQTGSPELRKKLPRGAVKEIAGHFGISWVWAYRVVSGKSNGDPQIISAALEIARIEDERRNRISALVEKNKREIEEI